VRTAGLLREKYIELPMKRPGLSRHFGVATLFLAGALAAEESRTTGPAAARNPSDAPAADRREQTVAAEADRRRALRTELIKLFDQNGDGKLEEGEWVVVREFLLQGRVPAAPRPSPGDEQRRLESVAVEVAKRRALRESAASAGGIPRAGLSAEQIDEAIRFTRAELVRLEKMAEQLARPQVEREKAKRGSEQK
jgi:hypothetical protein